MDEKAEKREGEGNEEGDDEECNCDNKSDASVSSKEEALISC